MRILIADDDPVTRLALETLLTRRGWELVTAIDGGEAYDILCRADAPKLAIVDWMMPFMSGPQLCRKLRESVQGKQTHIIMLTGKRGKEDVVTGLGAGADDYVRKPFEIDELHARLCAAQRIIELQEQLRSAANLDHLTGILNRRAVLDSLRSVLANAADEGTPVSIALIDVDRFKDINDAYGHLVGDAALRSIARLLNDHIRSYDVVGRYGGEEFLVVLPGCGLGDAFEVAERVRAYVARQSISTSAGALSLTISIGIASGAGDVVGVEGLIFAADKALYTAKNGGRNRVLGALGLECVPCSASEPARAIAGARDMELQR
jgi:two-component system cell cycle response regulator